MLEFLPIIWLATCVLGAGIFGIAVEIFGTEWVDELWDRIQPGRR